MKLEWIFVKLVKSTFGYGIWGATEKASDWSHKGVRGPEGPWGALRGSSSAPVTWRAGPLNSSAPHRRKTTEFVLDMTYIMKQKVEKQKKPQWGQTGDSRPINTLCSCSPSCSQLSLPPYSSSVFPFDEGTSSFCFEHPHSQTHQQRLVVLGQTDGFVSSVSFSELPAWPRWAEPPVETRRVFAGCHGRSRTTGGRRGARRHSPCRLFFFSFFYLQSWCDPGVTSSRFHCLFTGFLGGLGLFKRGLVVLTVHGI